MRKTSTNISKLIVTAAIVLLLCNVWMMALNTGLAYAQARIVTNVKNSSHAVPEPVYIEVEKLVPTVTTVEVDRPVYIEVEKLVPTVTTVEVDRPVYIEKEIEVLREVPVVLQDWDSPEQLAGFLQNDDTDRHLILRADGPGGIALNGQCEDLALQLRDRAMAIGRYISVQVLNPGEYEKWYGRAVGPDVYHAICMARIGNGFWYVEPATDKYWLALNLD